MDCSVPHLYIYYIVFFGLAATVFTEIVVPGVARNNSTLPCWSQLTSIRSSSIFHEFLFSLIFSNSDIPYICREFPYLYATFKAEIRILNFVATAERIWMLNSLIFNIFNLFCNKLLINCYWMTLRKNCNLAIFIFRSALCWNTSVTL